MHKLVQAPKLLAVPWCAGHCLNITFHRDSLAQYFLGTAGHCCRGVGQALESHSHQSRS